MWQLFIVTFFDWWEIQFDQVWSSLIHFGRIWSKKIKNKTAIFILFKNVTTLYTDIFWYVQPLKSFFSDRTDRHGKTHRHRSSNSSLDRIGTVKFRVLKMVSDKIIYWLGRYSFIMGFIMSKKLKGLWFYILSKVQYVLTFFWHNKTQKSINYLLRPRL